MDPEGSIRDETSADRKPRIPAFDRHHSRRQATNIDPFGGHNLKSTDFGQDPSWNHQKWLIFLMFLMVSSRIRTKIDGFQNASTKSINISRLGTRLPSIESWDSWLSIDGSLVSNGTFLVHFVATLRWHFSEVNGFIKSWLLLCNVYFFTDILKSK